MANSKLKCRHCGEYFPREQIRSHPNHFCSEDHAVEWSIKKGREALRKASEKAEKEHYKQRKQSIMPLGTLCSKIQNDVNSMILSVDRMLGMHCIATGAEPEHAGHYFHAGTKYRISWLRFMHFNIHGQSAESNTHKSGDAAAYRLGMIERYGSEYVESLEEFKRMEDSGLIPAPTREELVKMGAWCRDMARRYRKASINS